MAMSVVYSNSFGMVVSETRNGVESDYVQDTLGSTIGLLDVTGTLVDRWEYWPNGEVIGRYGTNPTPLTFLGAIGYFKDIIDKLFYVRARHLRTDLARWLTLDPLWPNESAFGYARSRPTSVTDPMGLSSYENVYGSPDKCVQLLDKCIDNAEAARTNCQASYLPDLQKLEEVCYTLPRNSLARQMCIADARSQYYEWIRACDDLYDEIVPSCSSIYAKCIERREEGIQSDYRRVLKRMRNRARSQSFVLPEAPFVMPEFCPVPVLVPVL